MNSIAKSIFLILSIKYSNNDNNNNNNNNNNKLSSQLILYDLYKLWKTMTPKK